MADPVKPDDVSQEDWDEEMERRRERPEDGPLSTSEYTGGGRITISSDLEPLEHEIPMEIQEAADFLQRRFQPPDQPHEDSFWDGVKTGVLGPIGFFTNADGEDRPVDPVNRGLMIRIAMALPEEARTEHVLRYTDFRPLLHEVALTGAQASRTRKVHYVNDVLFTPEERVAAGGVLARENELATEYAQAESASLPADTTATERDEFVARRVNQYKEQDELGATGQLLIDAQDTELPYVEQQELQRAVESLNPQDQLWAELGMTQDGQAPYKYMTQGELEFMFQMEMVPWDQIIGEEAHKVDARAAGGINVADDFSVDTGGFGGMGTPGNFMGTGSMDAIERITADTTRVSLLGALSTQYYNRDTKQLQNMQDKLIAAGLLEEDEVRHWGHASDEATKRAYQKLLKDSMTMGKDMRTILEELTKQKRKDDEDEAKANQRDIVLTSGMGIKTTADALGQQVIGRRLSADQHARVVEFIHSLELDAERALEPEGQQIVEAIDVEAEVQQWIEEENSTEAGAHDMLGQFQAFSDFAKGPGV